MSLIDDARVAYEQNQTLIELQIWQCRYPQGDFPFEFCGRLRKSKSPYCPAHHALTHTRLMKREGRDGHR